MVKITKNDIDVVFKLARIKFDVMIERKGDFAFNSTLELLGAITQEYFEVEREIHAKGNSELLDEELFDLMMACFWGVMSGRAYARGVTDNWS